MSLSVCCANYNTFKHMAWNPSYPSIMGPRHGEVRRAHQMFNAALVTVQGVDHDAINRRRIHFR